MATIAGDHARCTIQMPDGNFYVFGVRDFRITMPSPEPVYLGSADPYTGAPPRHYVGHGDTGTFTAKLCPPPPEPEPATDAERLARVVLAGDHEAAGPLADLVQETWRTGNRHGPALVVLREALQSLWREEKRAEQRRAAGLPSDVAFGNLPGKISLLSEIIAQLESAL